MRFYSQRMKAVSLALCATLLFALAGKVSAEDWIYTVVEGDNLWDLSEKYLHRVSYYKQLQQINGVENPRRMPPGMHLRIPLKWIRSNPVPAEILEIRGDVKLVRADASKLDKPLEPGVLIQLGDRLETGASASVAVKFADGSVATLHENGVVRFDHLTAYGDSGMVDSRVHLFEGRLNSRVRRAVGPGSRFEIGSPSAISAVRGTELRVAFDRVEATSRVEVLKGGVAVSGQKKTRLIRSGFGTLVESGKPPIPPIRLLPAPKLEPLPEKIEQSGWPIQWQALDGADSYRMEIASNPDFTTFLWDRAVDAPRAALPGLPDGTYYVRVHGIAANGIGGLNTVAELILDVHPQPPIPLRPEDQGAVRGVAPELHWTASSEAASYRLQVAVDPDFETLIVDKTNVHANSYSLPDVRALGQYYWRLASIAPDGEQGPYSPTRMWENKPLPEKPEPEISADEKEVVAAWREGAAGQTYQVQISDDPEFGELMLDEKIDQAELRFAPAPGVVRYLRVRILEPDGFEGPWGATQRIDPAPDDSWIIAPILAILGFILI